MAIQTRRGNISDLDKSKLLPGEWACALDKKRVFMQFGTGAESVLEMPTKEEYKIMLDEVEQSAKEAQAAAETANEAAYKANDLLSKEKETLDNIAQVQTEVRENATATLQYKEMAETFAEAAEESRKNAQISADLTVQNLADIQNLAQKAEDGATNAKEQADLSRSYAVGTNGEVREGDEEDNAKYYKEQAENSAAEAAQSRDEAGISAASASAS
ncbi:MAG: hypothetical protein NC086_07790, partial [Alistipes sp.]|nr:hypothetical protein [Alistipes sp.]